MVCFPQLMSGATSQYPIRKRSTLRTIRNRCLDGREIKLADLSASSIDWALTFEELVDGEINALRDFFVSMEGSLGTFTFLDPTDNLLAWSEKLDEDVWQKDALLQLSNDISDPVGGSSAFHLANPAGAPLRLRQTLNAPAGFYYSLSIWARDAQSGVVTLVRGEERITQPIEPDWNRLTFTGASASEDESVEFGVEIAPGASVDLFGAQVEAQIGASNYKRTSSRNGIYPMTRFAQDGLALSTIGPGRHGCVVQLRTR